TPKLRSGGIAGSAGRSRRAQMELATAYGITDYQTPAGGCLLTDPVISRRIEGLLKAGGDVLVEDILILAVGRHFKLPGGMLYVGRNEKDNMKLLSLARKGDYIFKAGEIPGPVSLYRGGLTDEDIGIAASITVRYSDARAAGGADVDFREPGGPARTITAAPALDSGIVQYRLDY
ncbi:MAG: thiamine biosynthesis protein, partial [Nitrospirota bacterium]